MKVAGIWEAVWYRHTIHEGHLSKCLASEACICHCYAANLKLGLKEVNAQGDTVLCNTVLLMSY